MEPDSRGLYSYPLVSWPSVIAGATFAIAAGVMLNVLGVAIGATAFNPFVSGDDQSTALSVGGALWVVFSQLVALQLGAFIAARAAPHPDHHDGVLQGVTVWAVALVFAILIAAFGVSIGATALFEGAGHSAIADASQAIQNAADGSNSAAEVARADDVSDATATLAWLGFVAMAFGLVGAIAGGKLGGAHPKWEKRHRRVVLASPADVRSI